MCHGTRSCPRPCHEGIGGGGRNRGTDPLISKLDAWWRWQVSFMLRPLYPRPKNLLHRRKPWKLMRKVTGTADPHKADTMPAQGHKGQHCRDMKASPRSREHLAERCHSLRTVPADFTDRGHSPRCAGSRLGSHGAALTPAAQWLLYVPLLRDTVRGIVASPRAGRFAVWTPPEVKFFSFTECPDRLWGPASPLFNECRGLSLGKSTVMLTPQLHLLPRLRLSGAIPPHHLDSGYVTFSNLTAPYLCALHKPILFKAALQETGLQHSDMP
jgi:hypothetical protein